MKQLLAAIILLSTVAASAGNGAGTMGFAADEFSGIDLAQIPVIRFEQAVDQHHLIVSRVIDDPNTNEIRVQTGLLNSELLSPEWREAMIRSAATGDWEAVIQPR